MADIRKLAYELYKIDWKHDHGITPEIEKDTLKDYFEGLEDSEFNGEYTYEDYLDEFGYNGELYVCYDEFIDYEFQDKEYMEVLLDNSELYNEYLSLVKSQKEKKIIMETIFNVDLISGEDPADYIVGEKGYADIGGFTVRVPGYKAEIPFDFEAAGGGLNDDGTFYFGNYKGLLERIYDVDPCHEDEWLENGLRREDITAKMLGSAENLVEFYFNVADNNDRDIEAFLEVKEMIFWDENDNEYSINPDVIKQYNRTRVAEQLAFLLYPRASYANISSLIQIFVSDMSDRNPEGIINKITDISKLQPYIDNKEQFDFVFRSMIKVSEAKDSFEKDYIKKFERKSLKDMVDNAADRQQTNMAGNVPLKGEKEHNDSK